MLVENVAALTPVPSATATKHPSATATPKPTNTSKPSATPSVKPTVSATPTKAMKCDTSNFRCSEDGDGSACSKDNDCGHYECEPDPILDTCTWHGGAGEDTCDYTGKDKTRDCQHFDCDKKTPCHALSGEGKDNCDLSKPEEDCAHLDCAKLDSPAFPGNTIGCIRIAPEGKDNCDPNDKLRDCVHAGCPEYLGGLVCAPQDNEDIDICQEDIGVHGCMHYECINYRCKAVSGPGTNACENPGLVCTQTIG